MDLVDKDISKYAMQKFSCKATRKREALTDIHNMLISVAAPVNLKAQGAII